MSTVSARVGSSLFLTRITSGRGREIHTLSTNVAEVYDVIQMPNVTSSHNTESDVRVVPIPAHCRAVVARRMAAGGESLPCDPATGAPRVPSVILTGSYMHAGSFWRESQFMSVATTLPTTGALVPLRTWTLDDKDGYLKKRTQKNWLPFFVPDDVKNTNPTLTGGGGGVSSIDADDNTCALMVSMRFAPEHVVSEFRAWSERGGALVLFNTADALSSPTPSEEEVQTRYFLRGSAPPVHHPVLKKGYMIGCVHVKGHRKVYRTLLYVMETKPPFKIVSFSGMCW